MVKCSSWSFYLPWVTVLLLTCISCSDGYAGSHQASVTCMLPPHTVLRLQAYGALSSLWPGCWNLNTRLQHCAASTVTTESSLPPRYIGFWRIITIDNHAYIFRQVCVWVWVHVQHMCARPCRRQKRMLYPLKLELWFMTNHVSARNNTWIFYNPCICFSILYSFII